MISPLRKANDSPISLATPWFQAYVSLANRKRRERQFVSVLRTNEWTNIRMVCTESDINIAYAWQCVLAALCDDDSNALCGTCCPCVGATVPHVCGTLFASNEFDNRFQCVWFGSHAFIPRFVLNIFLVMSSNTYPVCGCDGRRGNVMAVNQLTVDVFLCMCCAVWCVSNEFERFIRNTESFGSPYRKHTWNYDIIPSQQHHEYAIVYIRVSFSRREIGFGLSFCCILIFHTFFFNEIDCIRVIRFTLRRKKSIKRDTG